MVSTPELDVVIRTVWASAQLVVLTELLLFHKNAYFDIRRAGINELVSLQRP